MKLLKPIIIIFSLAMLLSIILGFKDEIEAVKSLERWIR